MEGVCVRGVVITFLAPPCLAPCTGWGSEDLLSATSHLLLLLCCKPVSHAPSTLQTLLTSPPLVYSRGPAKPLTPPLIHAPPGPRPGTLPRFSPPCSTLSSQGNCCGHLRPSGLGPCSLRLLLRAIGPSWQAHLLDHTLPETLHSACYHGQSTDSWECPTVACMPARGLASLARPILCSIQTCLPLSPQTGLAFSSCCACPTSEGLFIF